MPATLPRPPEDECLRCGTATLWRDPRGFIVCDHVPRVVQTAETANEILDHAKELAGATSPAIMVLTNETRVDRSGLTTFAERGNEFTGVALIVKSKVSEMAGNFFVRIHKPGFPLRLFGEVDDAIEWLAEVGSGA
ncbi:MAG: hypothetical protein R3F61_02225 [Myxococcota bacterium]